MLRMLAIIFGIAFIFAGVAGFLPSFTRDGLLFGFFEVNAMQNIVHLLSGVFAIMAATRFGYAKLYFRLFGCFYALITIAGFTMHGILMMHFNMADNLVHLVIALFALYLGFFTRRKAAY